MKVILTEDVRNIGKRFDIKEVSDGYARNFLFPKDLAKPATPNALKELAEHKAVVEKEDKELIKRLEKIASLINERTLEFPVKTGDNGEVFGSVTKDMILKGLRDAGLIRTERVEIKIERPLKELGEHIVEVSLKKGISAKLKVKLLSQK